MIPEISLIIPTFNAELTISNCIDSIIRQTHSNFEILLIDGLSRDKTVKIVQDFNDQRIKIQSEPDDGIYDAMNKGIAKAQGEWLFFLGSDDSLYDNQVLASISEIVKTHVDVVYGNVIFKVSGKEYDGKFSKLKLSQKNICHQAIFVRKKIFTQLGLFDITYKGLADWHFNMKWFNHRKIKHAYVNRSIAVYNEDGYCFNNPDVKFSTDYALNIRRYFPWYVAFLNRHKHQRILGRLIKMILIHYE